jgi:hypothetical protein
MTESLRPLTEPAKHALRALVDGAAIYSSVSKSTMDTPRMVPGTMEGTARMKDVSWLTLEALVERHLVVPKKVVGERLLRWTLNPKADLSVLTE